MSRNPRGRAASGALANGTTLTRDGVAAGACRFTRLDNGVEVVTEAMAGARSVATGAWVRQGAAQDPDGRAGASHLLEHVVFRGTERRSRRQIALALESVGGTLNAYTAREHTGFEARVLDRHLPEAVDVLADLVRHPLLREEDVDHEKEVVCEEIAAVEDTPDDLVFEMHGDGLWGGHPYGRPIMGSRETLAETSRNDLAELHGRAYTGANLVLAAAGAVEHDEFTELVVRGFGDMEPGEEVAAVNPPPRPARGTTAVSRGSAQVHVVLGHPTPGQSHPDRYPLLLLSAALGGGMSSRLFQRIREELALAYAVYSYQSFYRRAGVCGTYLGTRPGSGSAALDAVREVYGDLAREGLAGGELRRTKDQVKGEIVLSLESPAARLHRLAGFALVGEAFVPVDELTRRIDRVSEDDILRLAGEVMDPERQYILCLGPEGAEAAQADHQDWR
ncbi:MAG: insulinase family protein [Gemmatimonadetes bacterium]|nr:insulinase family protein [Gemmatimonadota bacterium]